MEEAEPEVEAEAAPQLKKPRKAQTLKGVLVLPDGKVRHCMYCQFDSQFV